MNVEEFTQDAQGIESATWILMNPLMPPHPGKHVGNEETKKNRLVSLGLKKPLFPGQE